MRLLLDTHTFLWTISNASKLSQKIKDALADQDAVVYVSMATLWEIQIKHALGKLELDKPLSQIVDEQITRGAYTLLPIDVAHVLALGELPHHHGDPFDRILIAQAKEERIPIATVDDFGAYGVNVFW